MTPWQVVILERRSQAGRVLFRSVSGGWNGSEEDKHRLHEQLELLQRDPSYLTTDATLPELNNEMAPVSSSRLALISSWRSPDLLGCVFIQMFIHLPRSSLFSG